MNLKEENEKLRELLRRVYNYVTIPDQIRIDSALSEQNSNEVASPVQDEREAFEQHYYRFDLSRDPVSGAYFDSEVRCLWDAWQARADRPPQKVNNVVDTPEQHPDVKSGNPDLWSVTAGGTDSDMEYVVVRRSLLEAIAACEWRGEMAASSGNELRAVMAGRISYGLYPAPVAQTASQPEQRGLVEALKRIQCLMADRETQALDGSQDRQLFVTILNIADAALSPSIPATYSCDYAGCSSKAHPGTSLCLAHHSPKHRAALSAQGASK